jgi:hypothetical protein
MKIDLTTINWLSVIIAALSAFLLGYLWYSPILFGKRWMKESGVTPESAKDTNMVKVFGTAFILSLIAAFFLALFIGKGAGALFGALAGFMAGIGWVFTAMGISYLFERKTLAHFLINSLYSVVNLTIMGFIIGAWQ